MFSFLSHSRPEHEIVVEHDPVDDPEADILNWNTSKHWSGEEVKLEEEELGSSRGLFDFGKKKKDTEQTPAPITQDISTPAAVSIAQSLRGSGWILKDPNFHFTVHNKTELLKPVYSKHFDHFHKLKLDKKNKKKTEGKDKSLEIPGEELVEIEKGCIIVLVPGLFTNKYPGYMHPVISYLTFHKYFFVKAVVDTSGSVLNNAETLRKLIMECDPTSPINGRQIIWLGHSKGGVDLTAALSLYPELRERTRGVICLQAPYAGTPVADLITSNSTYGFVKKGFSALAIDPMSLEDLTHDARAAFLEKHREPVLAHLFPILCVATDTGTARSPMRPLVRYLKKTYGVISDGMVAENDALVPGGYAVYIEQLDHGATVFSTPGSPYSPGPLIHAILELFLQLPRPSAHH